jgi:hypothetical protein
MKNDPTLARLICEEWPTLKNKAEDETDVEKLIAVVSEIDDFLLRLEARVATSDNGQVKRPRGITLELPRRQ